MQGDFPAHEIAGLADDHTLFGDATGAVYGFGQADGAGHGDGTGTGHGFASGGGHGDGSGNG